MTPDQVLDQIDTRLWDVFATGANPWRAGAQLVAKRMGLEFEKALAGVVNMRVGFLRAGFTRVMQGGDPRLFRVAEAGERNVAIPALVMPPAGQDFDDDREDLLALSLVPDSRRFWRLTGDIAFLGDTEAPADGVLRLRQDVHGWARAQVLAAAYRRQAEEECRDAFEHGLAKARAVSGLGSFVEATELAEDDARRRAYLDGLRLALKAKDDVRQRWALACRQPDGVIVFDPLAIDWTRRGALKDIEAIEILDAPAEGALGRALTRLNKTIGSARGVPLYSAVSTSGRARRAA